MASLDSTCAAPAVSPEFSIDREVAVMKTMTVNQLAEKYAKVCGYPARSHNKQWLIKRIAWQIQANREGGLSDRALARAAELAKGAHLRMLPPREPKASPPAPKQTTIVPCTLKSDARLPFPGSALTRDYKGQRYIVSVLRKGFELDGTVYPSLTAVAKAITGKHWNGYHFFGLDQQGGAA